VAKHLRRRRRGSRERPPASAGDSSREDGAGEAGDAFFDIADPDDGSRALEPIEWEPIDWDAPAQDAPAQDPSDLEPTPHEDWFAPAEPGTDTYAARQDVSLASMLMLGASPYQRIDGMGLARKALETPPTGDPRRDLTGDERSILANARAWCLLVHGDLGHLSRLDDPFVLADAERFAEVARGISPQNPSVETTTALLRLRQGRTTEAQASIERAVEAFAAIPEHQRNGTTQGAAVLAVVTQALVTASSGDLQGARVLSTAARAVVTPLDLDEAAFAALLGEVERLIVPSP
jgi:hypothetical protein